MSDPFLHPVTGRPMHLGRTRARRNGLSRLKATAIHNFLSVLPDDFAPTEVNNSSGIVSWGEFLNDRLGDCTIAAPMHMIQAWTALSGSEVTLPDSVALACYESFDGYVNGDPSTDNGGDILTVCQDWQKYGIGGHYITAAAEVNMTQMRWQQALYIFKGLNAGLALPVTAQNQVGQTWDIVGDGKSGESAPGSWGLHCTAILDYSPEIVRLVTWGQIQEATWRFVMMYYDEAHACVSPDQKTFPLDVTTLTAVLQQIES